MHLRKFWERLTATSHSLELEREVARTRAENTRLRAENRALLNSILGIAGIPPITVLASEEIPMNDVAPPNVTRDSATSSLNAASRDSFPALTRPDKPGNSKPEPVIPRHGPRLAGPRRTLRHNGTQLHASPPRRRSWQQINRMLELESARKKPQEI
jgi:hypothetical protein